MAETTGVNAGGGVKNVGSESHGSVKYEFVQGKAQKKVYKLRVGELVKGTIVSIPKKDEAVVRLPIGTLTAELHGQLKEGDSLLFKVESINPNLVLKIHSVSTVVSGNELVINDIIRILDLPLSVEFTEIVKHLMQQQSSILRQDALLIHANLIHVPDNIIKNFSYNVVIKALELFNKMNLKYNSNLFLRFLPTFLGPKYFEDKINRIKELIKNDDLELNEKLNVLFSVFENKSINKNIKRFVLLKSNSKEKTLYEILADMMHSASISKFSNKNVLIKNIESLLSMLEGQFLINLLSSRVRTNAYLTIPLLIENKFKIIQFVITPLKESKSSQNNIRFKFNILGDKIGNIENKGALDGIKLDLSLLTEDETIKKEIENELIKLRDTLSEDGFVINSLAAMELNEDEIKTISSTREKESPGFSVVI